MRGDLRPANVREFDDGLHVFRRPGRLFFLRPVEVELEEVRSVVELRRRGLQEGGPVIRLDQEATCDHAAVADPRSGDPNPRSIRVQSPPFPHAEGEGRFCPSRGSTASGDPTSRAQRTPARPKRSPLCSATSSSSSGGSAPRSIQCEPPGSVTWLWASTMPGTIVEPPASMTWTSGGRAPSSLPERIQTTWPASSTPVAPRSFQA